MNRNLYEEAVLTHRNSVRKLMDYHDGKVVNKIGIARIL